MVITAGPTHEPLDAVRFLGNRSSGKMGFALAEVLAAQGAEVTLSPVPSPSPRPTVCIHGSTCQTAEEMNEAVQEIWKDMDLGIACAAVSDFRPAETSKDKWHRGDVPEAVELIENPDILATMGATKQHHQRSLGFASRATTGRKRTRQIGTQEPRRHRVEQLERRRRWIWARHKQSQRALPRWEKR